ncbi:hypothetical protein [Saccharicrinis fermentans]|uniref:Uncharacterized protein n=1 Tax=Saccharicrinis fermentans DSM 9555 = JCM 21142 TaxID=869213 RepID=W7YT00_9BACT|nr:hypothetical protein [Saccharicrinis fermentans]GAF05564.1 hypothetical protein JCM21142_104304 [Saccharicrinis fermentans DSM 9555 = JCM 21142]
MFYRKLFKDLELEERQDVSGKYFICLHSPHYSGDLIGYQPYFEYLVIFENELICRFKELDKAKEYVQIMNDSLG